MKKWPSVGDVICVLAVHTPLSSPKGQGPDGPRVGSDLCLWTQLCRLLDHSFLAFGVCCLVGEAVEEFCAGFPMGRACACLLMGGAGSWLLMGRAVSRGMSRGDSGLRKSLGSLSADG